MAFFHGVKASEVPTSIVATVATDSGLPVVFGTAPVHLTEDPTAYVNKPVICYSWKEATQNLGYHPDWDKYTLCEAMYTEFKLYNVKPIVFVNVLDPAKHKVSVSDTAKTVTKKQVILTDPVLLHTLTVKGSADESAATLDKDYTAAYDDDGQLIITLLDDGALASVSSINVTYDKLDSTAVKDDDIIGGMSTDGKNKGLELVDDIYFQIGKVPGLLAAPGWSEKPAIAAVMKAKAAKIDGLFPCMVLVDINTEQVKKYADVNMWKNGNNYTGNNQIVCWPCAKNGDMVFHLSTHIMGIIGVTDGNNDDVPYQSPSNQKLQATGLCLKDGSEVNLNLTQANLLNEQGIVTGLNFSGGWKSWGNFTGAYPGTTDVKDMFICVRRMFNWQYVTFILTNWQKTDQPITPRLVKTLVDSEQVRLNGLTSRGYLLGASVQFLADENPTTDLLAGIFRIHTKLTPPVPAQDIEDTFEYDVSNFEVLFS